MMKNQFKAVILAAGESSRFWPLAKDIHKSMYTVAAGKPILYYTLLSLKRAGIKKVIIVASSKDQQKMKNYFGNGEILKTKIDYVIQKEALGMGNALLSAKHLLKNEPFFLLNADKVNADELILPMIKYFSNHSYKLVLSSRSTNNPSNYGILKIVDNQVKEIIEKPSPGTEPSNQRVIGVYLLPSEFLEVLETTPLRQYNFEDALGNYINQFGQTGTVSFDNVKELSLKFPWHLLEINEFLMKKYISSQKISPRARISPEATIEGPVIIEDEVKIFENVTIKGPCFIGKGTIVGNNVLIRNSYIGKNAVIGYNTEIARSLIYNNVHTHINYLGDSIIDEDSRLGAGTITANVRIDRKNIFSYIKEKKVDTSLTSLGVIFGKNVKTGIHVSFMPGIKIGKNSNLGPGALVTEDVPENSLYYIKFEKIVKKIRLNTRN